MTDCTKCKRKNTECFCPPGRRCLAFEKEVHKVRYAFDFLADDDWVPGGGACWTDCPFSVLIGLGGRCRCTEGKALCPFLNGSYAFKQKEI